jgi:hypothetical protein
LLPFCYHFLQKPNFPTDSPSGARRNATGALPGFRGRRLKIQVPLPPCRKTGKEVAMKTGVSFIQRMKDDDEFRQKVNACANGVDRLAFLKSEGYDFTPFMQILNNLSSCQQTSGGLRQPDKSKSPRQSGPNLWNRITQIFRSP